MMGTCRGGLRWDVRQGQEKAQVGGCGQEPILAWLRLEEASDGSRSMQRCHQPMVFEAAISAAVLVT